MASEARILANRRNAGKSTGPRTTQGKAVVAQNAVKHGLLARQDIIQGEDWEQFELCRQQLLGELEPLGHMEAMLAASSVSPGGSSGPNASRNEASTICLPRRSKTH